MKARYGPYAEEFSRVVLYLDDLEKLVGVFREVCGPDSVRLITVAHELDDLEELAKLQEELPKGLEIVARTPDGLMVAEFKPYRVAFFAEKDTPVSRGVCAKIREALKSTRPFYWPLFTDWGFLVLLVVVAIVTISVQFAWFSLAPPLSGWSVAYIPILWVAAFGFCILVRALSNSLFVIVPKRRSQAPSFWKRNQDQIVVNIIVALASGAIGWVVGLLSGAFSR